MKYLKILGLAAIAATALMAFAGSASATTLTNGSGAVYGVGTVVHADSEGVVKLKALFGTIECKSTVEGKITRAGGPNDTETVEGNIETLIWFECGPGTCSATTLKPGSLVIHTETTGTVNGNGTLTGTGQEVETNCFGLNCIWTTSSTDLGKVTGSKTGDATLDISATINRTGGTGGGFCGSTGTWSGSYTVTSPSPLYVD